MDRHRQFSNRFFLLGLGLLSLIVYTLLLAAIAYVRGQVMNPYIFPIAVAMTGITQFFAAKALFPHKTLRVFFEGLLIALAIAGGSIWTAGKVYDLSSEGQWLHQETIRRLKTGWNPYVKTLEAPDIQIAPGATQVNCSGPDTGSDSGMLTVPDPKYLRINYQPKGIEIVASAIYSLTGQIETGKAVNLLALLGSCSLCLAWLYGKPDIAVARKWALALLAAGNPVTLAQLATYRTEGTLAALCLSLLVCSLMISESVAQYRVFLFGLLLIFCLNIRQGGWIYPVVIVAGVLLFLFLKKDRVKMKKIFYASLLSAAVGLIFIGFHPFISNLISGENAGAGHLNTNFFAATPEYTWKGYAFPLWLLPVAGLLVAGRSHTRVMRGVSVILYGALSVNFLLAVWGSLATVFFSAEVNYQLQQMKALDETILIEVCADRGFESNSWRLQENDIPYNLGRITGGFIENIPYSTTRVGTETALPVLPKSWLVRWAKKFQVFRPE